MKCPHCEKLKIFDLDNPREYWLMTEMFVHIHGGDTCQLAQKRLIKNMNKNITEEQQEKLRVFSNCIRSVRNNNLDRKTTIRELEDLSKRIGVIATEIKNGES